jgi:hypothetical protein
MNRDHDMTHPKTSYIIALDNGQVIGPFESHEHARAFLNEHGVTWDVIPNTRIVPLQSPEEWANTWEHEAGAPQHTVPPLPDTP